MRESGGQGEEEPGARNIGCSRPTRPHPPLFSEFGIYIRGSSLKLCFEPYLVFDNFLGTTALFRSVKWAPKNGVNSRQNSPKWQNRPKFSVFYAKKGTSLKKSTPPPVVAVVTVVTNISFVLNLSLL